MIARFFCNSLSKIALARVAQPALGLAPVRPAQRQRFEAVVGSFLGGFQHALEGKSFTVADGIEQEWRGFWLEGAAMGVVLRDRLMPWRRRQWEAFLREAGEAHLYMLYVGAGWAMARLPGRVEKAVAPFDPLLRWLMLDGYGFHEGFFHPERSLFGQPHPARVRGYARRAFDQGLGRVMWFASGADVRAIAEAIGRFAEDRRADLWSGAGLGCTYAGRVDDGELTELRELAGPFLPQLAQGASFAAKARVRGGNLTDYQERACGILCEMSAQDAAALSDEALRDLPPDGEVPSFEIWRRRIQRHFAEKLEPIPA